jgi:biopolymer transport protein ExbB
MGVLSLAVLVERVVVYARSRRQSAEFARAAGPLLGDGHWSRVKDLVGQHPHSHLARMLAPALDVLVRSGGRRPRDVSVELVRRELLRQEEEAEAELRRGLPLLASIGSVAPFVGLLGTVVGIIAAFTKISETGSGGLGSVAGGISEALVVTALGLVVAIPAVLIFNRLTQTADRLHQSLVTAAGQFLDSIEFGAAGANDKGERQHGHGSRQSDAPAA